MTASPQDNGPLKQSPKELRNGARTLIRQQRVMVLATCLNNTPWSAAVYFVYHDGLFYFFSSPRALHSGHVVENPSAAATIFNDNDCWEHIQGIQMSGAVEQIRAPARFAMAAARYLIKFPFAAKMLGNGVNQPVLLKKVNLYAFYPKTVYYLNNKAAFGRPEVIALHDETPP